MTPNCSITVIESDYFPTEDVDDIKSIIREVASQSNILVIYTESVPVTARWMSVKERTYNQRLPGSDEANMIDKAIQTALIDIQEEFIYAVYYPSTTNLDNAHNVLRLLDENDGNLLFIGRTSIIIDYRLMTRQEDDYMLDVDTEVKEYISLHDVRNKLSSEWASIPTFVLMTHLVRGDFGPRVIDLSINDLVSKSITHELTNDDGLLPVSDFVRNLTISMVKVMDKSEDILSGMNMDNEARIPPSEFESSLLAYAINKWDPSFLQEEYREYYNRTDVSLYLKLQYVGLYLLNKEIDYSWTVNPLIKTVYIENVKFVYDRLINYGDELASIVRLLENKRSITSYDPIPTKLYRTAIMESAASPVESRFWNMLYSSDVPMNSNIDHYKAMNAPILPRNVLIAVAKANIPSSVIQEPTGHEIIFSSMMPKRKPAASKEETRVTEIPTTKFNTYMRTRE
jgi:hypothetical protein